MAAATGTSQADGIQQLATHQSAIVTAEAQVPEPGWRCPMPKKVAMSQETRDLGAVFGNELIMLEIANVIEKDF
jgi:hypothetical protein